MGKEIQSFQSYEGPELAETTNYYLKRNVEALKLLAKCEEFALLGNISGTGKLHFESMVIRNIVDDPYHERRVKLFPALAINGAREEFDMIPAEVTLLPGTEIRSGFIAVFQRDDNTPEVGAMLFLSDDNQETNK